MTELDAENEYQIREARVSEEKSTPNYTMIEQVKHIESGQLDKYNGLKVEDISERMSTNLKQVTVVTDLSELQMENNCTQ